jgi:transposase
MKSKQRTKQYKAITYLKLSASNAGKLKALDAVSAAYLALAQDYVDYLIDTAQHEPDPKADLPSFKTALSARWQRTAWRQACGMVQSWYNNEHTNRPVLRNICIQANTNVAKLEKANGTTFDYWLRLATLDKGNPVLLPIKLYKNAHKILAQYDRLCSSVSLNNRQGRWYVTFVVERKNKKPPVDKQVTGIDIGMKAVANTSQRQRYGEFLDQTQRRLKAAHAKFVRKQKLNVCLKKKGLPTVSLEDGKMQTWVRNGIGQALNQLIAEWPEGHAAAIERLKVKDMRFKSRAGNRLLRASQLGYILERLKFKLDEAAIRYRSVQAAYSSQQCSRCGFTLYLNRRSTDTFQCLWCGHTDHADNNAADTIAERFGDVQLNALFFRQVELTLQLRFMAQLPVARSATATRDTLTKTVLYPVQLVPPPGQSRDTLFDPIKPHGFL